MDDPYIDPYNGTVWNTPFLRKGLMQDEFDAIGVGAGPCGSAGALTMAQSGLEVLLIERGRFPGEKKCLLLLFLPALLENFLQCLSGFYITTLRAEPLR